MGPKRSYEVKNKINIFLKNPTALPWKHFNKQGAPAAPPQPLCARPVACVQRSSADERGGSRYARQRATREHLGTRVPRKWTPIGQCRRSGALIPAGCEAPRRASARAGEREGLAGTRLLSRRWGRPIGVRGPRGFTWADSLDCARAISGEDLCV